jgi:hypothetical protein
MNTLDALIRRQFSIDNEVMVFDWIKAAKLIKERKPIKASAGLEDDWGWTGGLIYLRGKIIKDYYTYLASSWATPQLDLDRELIDCYVMQSEQPSWGCDTKWPKEALEMLK